jgi:hypothetical protein
MLATNEDDATVLGGQVPVLDGQEEVDTQLLGGFARFCAHPSAWRQLQLFGEFGAHCRVNEAYSESEARLQLRWLFHPALWV